MERGPSLVPALKFPDWPWNPMADLVLSCRDRASFCSSVWSSWTSAPFDLHLVAEVCMKSWYLCLLNVFFEDGVVGAHSTMILPQSRQLAAIVKALPYTTGPTQVVTR